MEDALAGAGNRRVTRSDDYFAPGINVHPAYSGQRFARRLGEALPGDAVTCECESVLQSPAAVCKDCIRPGSGGF